MTNSATCNDCGAALSDTTLGGLCPNCLAQVGFGFAMQSSTTGETTGVGAEAGGADFGGYLLVREVARGGMGVVYEARQKSLSRTVAVKMILGGRFASDEHVQRFLTEAEAAARLRHPNIVSIHEVGQCEGQHFFSMDFVNGQNLGEVVDERPLSAEESAELLQQVAEAVHYAHKQGVIHRDIKPSNILVDHRGDPHITDFGLAKLLTASEWGGKAKGLTISGQVMGSPSFVAPEQAGGAGSDIGPAIDVYSLGAVLYYLLTGRPPFVADNLELTLSLVLNSTPPSPRLLNPALPKDLETICLKCLDREPTRRYDSAQDFADELGRFRRGEAIHARATSTAEKLVRWAGRNRLLAGLAATSLLLLFVGMLGIFLQWRRAEGFAASEQQERARAEMALADLQLQHAELRLSEGDTLGGIAYLSHLLETDPGHTVAAERLLSVLANRNFALPEGLSFRHDRAIAHAEFSPDGSFIVTASEDHTARIWSATTGEEIAPALLHDGPVQMASISPDGMRVVTIEAGGAVRVWSTETGAPLGPVISHDGRVDHADFHPTLPRVLTGTRTGKVRVWDLERSEELIETDFSHSGELAAAAFDPEGSRILSVGRFDGLLQIFNAETGKRISKANFGGNTRIEAAGFSPDGRRVAIASYNRFAQVWDLSTGQSLFTFRLLRTGIDLAFSPDGELLATASRDGRVVIWDLETGERAREFTDHHTWVQHVEFSSDGLRLLTREFGQRAHVWDLLTGEQLTLPLTFEAPLRSIHFDPSGERVLAATEDGRAQIWDIRPSAPPALLLAHKSGVSTVAWQADGSRVIVTSGDGSVKIWDAVTGRRLISQKQKSRPTATLSPDGETALVGLQDGGIVFWKLKTGEQHTAMHGAGRITHTEISSDGTRGLTAGFNGIARVWDLESGEQIGPGLKHEARLWHASFSPDGERVVTCSDDWRDPNGDNTARIWNHITGEELTPPLRHGGGLYRAVFSPDGTRVLTASFDHTAVIWNAATGEKLHILNHEGVVQVALFDTAGERVVTASWDNTARVWDAATGRPLTPSMRHDGEVYWAEFSRDGTRIATACSSGHARVWDSASGHPVSDPLAHSPPASRAHFSPDGNSLLVRSDHAYIWDLPGPGDAEARQLPRFAVALAGRQIEEVNHIRLPLWIGTISVNRLRVLPLGSVGFSPTVRPAISRLDYP